MRGDKDIGPGQQLIQLLPLLGSIGIQLFVFQYIEGRTGNFPGFQGTDQRRRIMDLPPGSIDKPGLLFQRIKKGIPGHMKKRSRRSAWT